VMNFRKKQRRGPGALNDQTAEALADRMLSLQQRADARLAALERCLQKLSDRDRDLIQQRYQPDATTADVADRVGRSTQAVYKALNRIHEQLLLCVRQNLAAEGRS
jgi:RNA polymerase sigma-70 factor, ECF subfamily